MTTVVIEMEAVEQTAPDPEQRVFHLPATEADYRSRENGGPWTTLCGLHKPTCTQIRFGFELAEMEKCVVCRELSHR